MLCGLLLFFTTFSAIAAPHTVKGVVMDTFDQPVMGAAILSADGKVGTTTDLDGNFTITIGDTPVTVEVSCLGFQSKKITIQPSQGTVNVLLEETSMSLDATVVVGYGSQKKSNLTGALSVVESDQLADRSALDVGHMLQGAVPGLNITASSGRPGQAADINIRGLNSINGGSPLVLIDGVEGDLQKVAANDVESISVIKDAAAAAIYGARASFGVIIVTTKMGSEGDGKATVRYSGRFGFTAPTTSTEYVNTGYESVLINNRFFKIYDGNNYAKYTDEDMAELYIRRNDVTENPNRPWVVVEQRNGKTVYNYYANTDWYHYLYKDIKPTQSHSLSISGGTKKIQYLLSGSYNQEEGVFKQKADIYRKYNLRSKLNFEVTKWLSINNNTSFFSSTYDYPGISGVNNAFGNSTVHALASYPIFNPDGSGVYMTQYNSYTVMDGYNLAIQNDGFKNIDKVTNFSNTIEIVIKPIKQLDIRANYTYTFYQKAATNRSVNAQYSQTPGVLETLTTGKFENKLTEISNTHNYHAANVYATYSDTFVDAHNLKIMLGFNYETKHLKDITSIGYNLMSDDLSDLNLVGPAPVTEANPTGDPRYETKGGQNQYAIMGFFGRINYDYKGKYLFELSGRYDGTSRFAAESRWGFFPSGSAGWRISEEKFFAPAKKVMNNLKLRYSYGRLGNQQVGYYDYIRTVSTGTQSYLFGGGKSSSASLSNPVASDLTWETVEQHNVGLDMGFFNNRLNFTGEFYVRNTLNMLTDGLALPAVYGANPPKMNNADLRTMGYELSVSWKDMIKLGNHPFEYSASVIFSDYKSKITRYDNPDRTFAKQYYVGQDYGEIWGYHIDGLFATDEEAKNYPVDQSLVNSIINQCAGEENGLRAGDLKYADLDGDGKIGTGKNTVDNPGDKRVIGNSQPRFNYGINLGIKYFGFDLSVFLQGVGHMDWYPGPDARAFWSVYARPYMTFVPKGFLDDCWSESNPNAYFPRPRGYVAMSDGRELGTVNDRYIQNIGYCRLKNVTFGYSLPKKVLEKAKIGNLRFYFTGENLATICGIHSKYVDPEMAQAGGKLYTYPWQMTVMFGIDLTF